ncbi:MAG TPA: hypothetical protein PKZ83_16790 [bacterium]|nr:hypothetical protein [bacterium]HQJ66289.1 hypothetical protein [bacterium]
MEYTKSQLEYIDSVDGLAHSSAVDIIGKQDARISELEQRLKYEEWAAGNMSHTAAWLQAQMDAGPSTEELEALLEAMQKREKEFRVGLATARDLLLSLGKMRDAQEMANLLARFPVAYGLEPNHEK